MDQFECDYSQGDTVEIDTHMHREDNPQIHILCRNQGADNEFHIADVLLDVSKARAVADAILAKCDELEG